MGYQQTAQSNQQFSHDSHHWTPECWRLLACPTLSIVIHELCPGFSYIYFGFFSLLPPYSPSLLHLCYWFHYLMDDQPSRFLHQFHQRCLMNKESKFQANADLDSIASEHTPTWQRYHCWWSCAIQVILFFEGIQKKLTKEIMSKGVIIQSLWHSWNKFIFGSIKEDGYQHQGADLDHQIIEVYDTQDALSSSDWCEQNWNGSKDTQKANMAE